jgi:CheY-like chemotaxis protein
MLTSSADRGDARRCREEGITGYISKPVKQSELLSAIRAVLGKSLYEEDVSDRKAPVPDLTAGGRTGYKILLAEDNPINQKLARRLVEKAGHSVITVSNGLEVLKAMEEISFDLVLMDIQMPEMDGLQATTLIREKERTSGGHVPIVAMTAYAMNGDRERFLEAGMDDYLSKPIKSGELHTALNNIFERDRQRPEPVDRDLYMKQNDAFDLAGLLDRVDGDIELLQEMVDIFLRDLPHRLAEIEQAITGGRQPDLEKAVHGLKGSIGYFTSAGAYRAADNLMEMVRANRLDRVAETFAVLKQEAERLKTAMLEWKTSNDNPDLTA